MFTDQHGRVWHATIETKTMHPTGPIQPQFQAPLIPPQMYLRVGTNRMRPYDLVINYDQWIADLRKAREDWLEDGEQRSRLYHGEKYEPGTPFTSQILQMIGRPPQHVEPVIAAKQGNRYVLGLTNQVDVRLFALLEEERRTHAIVNEPDFSEVVTSLDDVIEEEEETAERKLAELRARDRERKRVQREARKAAQSAA